MIAAIIVAGGQGTRFAGKRAKQYLPLAGRPVLSHTLSVFAACEVIDRLVLVVPAGDDAYCRENVWPQVVPTREIVLVTGGEQRQNSVLNGLRAVSGKEDDSVLIHDGVRPFVPRRLIHECLAGLEKADGCIAAVAAVDTLKTVGRNNIICDTLDRESVWLAQTPQAFRYGVIRRAHEAAVEKGRQATDDASLLEWQGHRVAVARGTARNIKITTPDDMALAEALLHVPTSS